jgi:lactate permease
MGPPVCDSRGAAPIAQFYARFQLHGYARAESQPMTWEQQYDPLGNLFASALVAALPVVVLLGLLGIMQVRAYIAALWGLASALVIAVAVFHMPAVLAAAAAAYGAAYGLFPIGWIVLNAIFIYDITVKTGKFEIVKHGIAALASDRRIQALLIAFSFGAFIEGAAGFGTPVAISAALLVGLGFKPLQAAGLALLGNTAPVAYGALGTPLIALQSVTGLDLLQLSAMVGRQLPFFSLLIPFWLIVVMAGWGGLLEVWPACLVAGGSFAVSQFLVSNFHGPWLVDVISSAVSMVSLVVLLRFWQPRSVWRFEHERGEGIETFQPSRRDTVVAWMPWVLLCVFVFVWGLPAVKAELDRLGTRELHVPYLDNAVVRTPPVVLENKREKAVFSLSALSATGTALLVAGVVGGLLLRLSPVALVRLYWQTLRRVMTSLITIAAMLALGFTSRYSGLDATMGLAFARTGPLFPFFSPLLGWLGVALTGSDTSSNVLFGNLQQVAAARIGVPALLTAAANSSGGVMGKMIDAQSIVVASVATESVPAGGSVSEDRAAGGDANVSPATVLRFVFFHSIALAVLVGVLVLLQAYVIPWTIPSAAR